MVKVSTPATAVDGRSTDPGQGALSSPQGEVPKGPLPSALSLPMSTAPTFPRPEPAGSATEAVFAALFPVPRPACAPAPMSSQLSSRIVTAPLAASDMESDKIKINGVFIVRDKIII